MSEATPIEGFYIGGISRMITAGRDFAAEEMNDLWQQFYMKDILHMLPDRTENAIYAVYSDYEGDHTQPFRLTIGCKLRDGGNITDGLHKIYVAGGDYSIFAAAGEQPKALSQTWQSIWKMPLKRSYKTDLEIYGPRFFQEGLHEVLVCIGVENVSN